MDWHSTTFDWNHVRAFLVTAEEGSLSAAARALGIAQPTVGRQVSAFEAELGVDLFERTGRGLTLTPTGLALLEDARAMGAAAAHIALTATGRARGTAGPVAISASEVIASHMLAPVIAHLRAEAPGIVVEIVASNAISDLKHREADIALRNADPKEPDLIARRLRDRQATFYAADSYLERIGRPRVLAHLEQAEFIGFERDQPYLKGIQALGLPVTAANFTLRSANHAVQWQLMKQGFGIGTFPVEMGDAEPGVSRVLPEGPMMTYPVWLVAHREVRTSRRIRIVFDAIASLFGDH